MSGELTAGYAQDAAFLEEIAGRMYGSARAVELRNSLDRLAQAANRLAAYPLPAVTEPFFLPVAAPPLTGEVGT
jgi:hypothetical protein